MLMEGRSFSILPLPVTLSPPKKGVRPLSVNQ